MTGLWRRLWQRRRDEVRRAVDDEIAMHLELKTAALVASGMSPDAARAEAVRQFGDLDGTADALRRSAETRVAKRGRRDWLGGWMQDVRHAFRSLGRTPGVSIAVIVMLALGIGANAATFGILDHVFLKPPAYVVDPDGLYRVFRKGSLRNTETVIATFDFRLYSAMTADIRGFAAMSAHAGTSFSLGRGQDAARVDGTMVTGNFFEVVGVSAALGRPLTPSDDAPGAPPAAVISHDFRASRYRGRADVLGDTLRLGGVIYAIVGVMPEGFGGAEVSAVDVWVPLQIAGPAWKPLQWKENRMGGAALQLLARLNAGVTPAAAAAEATTVVQSTVRSHNDLFFDQDAVVVLGPILVARGPGAPRTGPPLPLIVGGVAAIVLLIACINVGNLLSLRAVARRREIAVRHALGSGRWRVARLLMVESLVFAVISGVVALGVAGISGGLLRSTLLPGYKWASPIMDMRVLLLAGLVALIIGVLAGVAPIVQASHREGLDDLRQGQRSAPLARTKFRFSVLAVQSALTLLLLVGTAVFYRSFREARAQDLGLETDHLLVADVTSPNRSDTLPPPLASMDAIVERSRYLPGVSDVALSTSPLMNSWHYYTLRVPGWDKLPGRFNLTAVGPNFFELIGSRIVSGRGFTIADDRNAARVAIVDREMARLLWPGTDPLGQCLQVGGTVCATVVGVVSEIRDGGIQREVENKYYLPLEQYRTSSRVLIVRVSTDASTVVPAVLRVMRDIFPELPRSRVYALSEVMDRQTRKWRVGMTLFGIASGLALLLAAIGLYAVVAFSVRQREHEFGIRRALGAQTSDLVGAVLRQGFLIAVAGIVLGVGLAWYAGRFLTPLLFQELTAKDPIAVTVSALVLTAVALAASVIPALTAARADPRTALQSE